MKYLILTLTLVLAACSSSTKTESYDDMTETQPLSDVTESTTKLPEPQPLPTPVSTDAQSGDSTTDKLHDQLDAAIQKQDDRAIALTSRELLIRSPKDIKALNAIALYYYRHSDVEAAKSFMNKAIASDPNVSMLHSNLGMILQTQKDTFEATRAYREALRIDPNNPIASANLGSIYASQKNYMKAQFALETAVMKGQRDWRTLSNYGTSLMAVGKYKEAEAPLKKASELQPQNAEILMNYAILLVDHLGKPSQGLELINKIRYIGPGPDLRKRISELENRAKSVLK